MIFQIPSFTPVLSNNSRFTNLIVYLIMILNVLSNPIVFIQYFHMFIQYNIGLLMKIKLVGNELGIKKEIGD